MTDADRESTSAALRRAEQERDELREALVNCHNALVAARDERDLARAELVSAQARVASKSSYIAELITERDQLRVEYGQVFDALAREKTRRSDWIVARDAGYTCERCDQLIRRGEAYEPLDGVDDYRHIRCPDRPIAVGDTVAYMLHDLSDEPQRIEGTVTKVAADGYVTAQFDGGPIQVTEDGHLLPAPQITVMASAEDFIPVRTTPEGGTDG